MEPRLAVSAVSVLEAPDSVPAHYEPMPKMPALRRWGQENRFFKASLGYVRPRHKSL